MRADVVDRLLSILGNAHGEYFGEQVTQLEHALQCADLARVAGADDELIAAALLHDIGHLIAEGDETGAVNHDAAGAAYLRELGCSATVAALVEGHVQAKRYLTAVDAGYYSRLSETSKQTLSKQGGPMSPAEVSAFAVDSMLADKLRLRTWDERAKEPGARTGALEDYREILTRSL
jgi:putative nucleotidyltransferase with HDIG domain